MKKFLPGFSFFLFLLLSRLASGQAELLYYPNSQVAIGQEALKHNTNGSLNKLLRMVVDSSQKDKFWIYGQFNPYLNYRKLSKGYSNTYGGNENLSFAPYPNFLSPTVNTLQPTLVLRFGGRSTENVSFDVDYAFYYNYDSDKTHKANFSGQNNLVAGIRVKKNWGLLNFKAGAGVIPIHFSPLTLSNKYIREPMFDRVPWEYHANSAMRYRDNFTKTAVSPNVFNRTGTQGFFLHATDLPKNMEAN
jgi:hypothetical protein